MMASQYRNDRLRVLAEIYDRIWSGTWFADLNDFHQDELLLWVEDREAWNRRKRLREGRSSETGEWLN
jgi:hypothetical protein